MKRIKLDDIILYIESYSDELSYYIDSKTSELITIQNYYRNKAEEILDSGNEPDLVDYHDWEAEEITTALSILADTDKRYFWLPEKREILNDYDIMQDFCCRVNPPEVSINLLEAIRGRGAFRRFRSSIERFGLLEEWYDFLDIAYRNAAIELCERNGFSYE